MSALWWLWLPIAAGLGLLLVVQLAPGFYDVWIGTEIGLLELSHVVIPGAAFLVALRCFGLPGLRGRPWLVAWVAVMTLGAFYVAGEEASWGQHFFAWATPESWQAVNDQQETNLHNVSNWFDQIPRTVLEIGVIVGGILVPLVALARPGLRRWRFGVILPPLLCLPCAVLAELVRATERLAEHLTLSGQIFPRASEVQELYFYLFVLLYAVVLRRRLRRETPAQA